MTVYSLVDRKLALGLKWLAPGAIPAGAGAGRKARELAHMKPPPVGFVQLETAGGTQLGATIDPDDIGLPSAAAWLAQAQLSAVLVESLAENLYWLCAIEDGAVFPAGDMVGGKDLIAARLDEIRTDIAGSGILMYDKTGSFGLIDAEPLDFSDLAAGVDAAADILCQPARSRSLKKPLAVLATVLLITASGYGARSLYLSYMDASLESGQDALSQRRAKSLNDEKKSSAPGADAECSGAAGNPRRHNLRPAATRCRLAHNAIRMVRQPGYRHLAAGTRQYGRARGTPGRRTIQPGRENRPGNRAV